MSALLQIPKVLGTLRQKQDDDHMYMSYYKSQYHSQKYFSSLLSVLWENWFWNMWALKHTWSSGMQPSDIIIFQHFTIEETEAYKKHGVTFSQVAAGGIWPQAPWLQKGSEPLHYRGKKKRASFAASPELPWGKPKINIFQLLITKSHITSSLIGAF